MKKKLSILNIMLLMVLAVAAQGKAKSVFYFIGHGMGVNQGYGVAEKTDHSC